MAKKKIDKQKADELRVWLQENNITTGVNIDEDTKRYYPYNNLASQIIGFSGSDNQGLDGIEAIYDEELKGTKGKIQKLTDATGGDIQNTGENYVEAIASQWKMKNIDTVESAMRQAEKEYKKINTYKDNKDKKEINNKEKLPTWYGKDIKKREMSDDDIKELESMLSDFR